MGRKWFDAHDSVRARFQEASDLVGYSVADLCFTAQPSELTKTMHAQVSLLVLSYAMYEVLHQEREAPVSFVTGHSLGEITALTAAGALSFADAVRLVKVRGEAMEVCARESGTGMIAALRMPAEAVDKHVAEFNADGHNVQISNYNTDTQTVISGTVDDLKGMTAHLEERGGKVAKLNVAGAFHSTFMAGAVPAYTEAIAAVEFHEPRIPVYSSVTGRPHESAQGIKDALAVQLTSPVRWSDIVAELSARKVGLWVEVGPKQVLKKMVSGVVTGADVLSLDEEADKVHAAVDRLIEAKKREPGLVGLCMGAAAATRNRNFDDDEYAAGVVAPYRRLQELGQLGEAGAELSDEQKRAALDLLFTIMRTKGVPEDEQRDRVLSILRRTGDTDLHVTTGAPLHDVPA
ncbi:ACP S-malonyltransferase [Actinokineospora sp. G85]|uniref:ACP S-malonyltransferase n=1 Tax=Actinokineospora sp. G85 TaxID=3406626 RepID=UPI003C73E8CC